MINPLKLVIAVPLLVMAAVLAFAHARGARNPWLFSSFGITMVCAAVVCWLLLVIFHLRLDE